MTISGCPPPLAEVGGAERGREMQFHNIRKPYIFTGTRRSGDSFSLAPFWLGSLILNICSSLAALQKYFHFLPLKRNMQITEPKAVHCPGRTCTPGQHLQTASSHSKQVSLSDTPNHLVIFYMSVPYGGRRGGGTDAKEELEIDTTHSGLKRTVNYFLEQQLRITNRFVRGFSFGFFFWGGVVGVQFSGKALLLYNFLSRVRAPKQVH